jgi:hypothetical protein
MLMKTDSSPGSSRLRPVRSQAVFLYVPFFYKTPEAVEISNSTLFLCMFQHNAQGTT